MVNSKVNGVLETYENNSMSLSCRGTIKILDSIIAEVSFKGYPRTFGDSWTNFYKSAKVGDAIGQEQINIILSCDGCCNVKSYFKNNKED